MTSTHHPAAQLLGLADSPLRQWLVLEAIPAVHEAMGESGKASDAVTVTALPGDAGLRRYYRMQIGERQFIVMDSSTDLPQLEPFLDVHTRMTASGLRAPAILAADTEQGFLVLQDFGDVLLKYILLPDDSPLPATAAQSLNELSLQQRGDRLFQQILPLLSALAQTNAGDLPVYDRERLQEELNLLPEWFLPARAWVVSEVQQQGWQVLCRRLIDAALQQPQVFVHRDFHACNLLYTASLAHFVDAAKSGAVVGDALGVIDFQDAVLGPIQYDLASWLWDRYVSWPREEIECWAEQARQTLAPDWSAADWLRSLDYMGLQRNIKVVGIFTRLAERDAKPVYLSLRPRFAAYCLDTLLRYPELAADVPWLVDMLSDYCAEAGDPSCRQ